MNTKERFTVSVTTVTVYVGFRRIRTACKGKEGNTSDWKWACTVNARTSLLIFVMYWRASTSGARTLETRWSRILEAKNVALNNAANIGTQAKDEMTSARKDLLNKFLSIHPLMVFFDGCIYIYIYTVHFLTEFQDEVGRQEYTFPSNSDPHTCCNQVERVRIPLTSWT